MEISKELQEQQTKTEDLFSEAELQQRIFIQMAEAEGLSGREIRRRWLYIVDWGMKERNAEIWKANLLGQLEDEDVDDIVESMDNLSEDLMTYAEPEDLLEQTKSLMIELDRRLAEAMKAYATLCAETGMSLPEITRAAAEALGRELPVSEEDDPWADDTLE